MVNSLQNLILELQIIGLWMKTNTQYPQARETKLVLCFIFSGNNNEKLSKGTSKENSKNSFFRNHAVVLL